MNQTKSIIYDGSFNGFLTAIFLSFKERIQIENIQRNDREQKGLFSETLTVFTQLEKAKRVWNGIQNKSYQAIKNIYFAFLSERVGIEMTLYNYIRSFFDNPQANVDFSEDQMARITQLAKAVAHEKRRLETMMQFQLTKDQVYFSCIAPDFNVLPLLSKHFRVRFKDEEWIIYDAKRRYGMYFNGTYVELIKLDLKNGYLKDVIKADTLQGIPDSNAGGWARYVQSLPIKFLLNQKVHLQANSNGKGFERKEAV